MILPSVREQYSPLYGTESNNERMDISMKMTVWMNESATVLTKMDWDRLKVGREVEMDIAEVPVCTIASGYRARHLSHCNAKFNVYGKPWRLARLVLVGKLLSKKEDFEWKLGWR